MSSSKDRVYRIAGLPPEAASRESAKELLDRFFGSDGTQATVRSLGPHPQRRGFMVAIAMFSPSPSQLQGGSLWRLEGTVQHGGKSLNMNLEIDTGFLGFTPLNLASGPESDMIDCIAVSGLSSHPFGSWKQRGGRFMWLVDDDESVPSNVRALLYGYDTMLANSESFQNISDIGDRLAASLKGIRPQSTDGTTFEPRPIVFIAHSLGGLVVKQAICQMAKADPLNARCVYGLVFFGTPHDGLLVEPWLRIVAGRPNQRFIEDLKVGSRFLQKLDQNFRDAITFPMMRVISVFETMTSKTAKEEKPGVLARTGDSEVIVTPSSALGRWPNSVLHSYIAVNRTHENLPKFNGTFDDDYLILKTSMTDIWQNAMADVQVRFDLETNHDTTPGEIPAHGLTQLWPNPEVDTTKIETMIDVIAIHGLGGHLLKTWVDGDRLWLRDSLPWDLPEARVLTYGYDSISTFLGSASGIQDSALQLLEAIRQVRRRDKGEEQRKIIFVCHSLGGIIFKQAFNLANGTESRYHVVGGSILGVIFLGTPHKKGEDASNAYWPKLLSRLINVAHVDSAWQNLDPAKVEAISASLGAVCSEFEESGMRLQIFSLYEVQPLHGSLVVDKLSAVLRLPHETTIPLDANHEALCKYLTSSSRSYVTVSDCIRELVEVSSKEKDEITPLSRQQREFLSELRAINVDKVLDVIPVHWGTSSKWLLDHSSFQSWTSLQGRQALWIYGPPGVGKTVLMRSVSSHLEEQRAYAAGPIIRKPVHFFFDDKDETRKTSDAFVRSILHQILRDDQTGLLFNYLDTNEWKQHLRSEEGLWRCLYTIVSKSHGIVFQFVIDAVDEVLRNTTSASVTVIDRLQHMLSLDSSGRVRLIISSRTKAPYEFSAVTDVTLINMDNNETKQNVDAFIRAQVRKSLERSHVSLSAGTEVEKKIIQTSRGNFLYAKLAWEQFSKGLNQWSREEMREGFSRLDNLSLDLVAAYCRLLASIPNQYKTQARVSFAILRASKERITSRQLSFLATLHCRYRNTLEPPLPQLRSESADFENYLSVACGFIINKSGDGTVDFAHVSARDLFGANLTGPPSSDAERILFEYVITDPDAHSILCQLCLKVCRLEGRTSSEWEQHFKKMDEEETKVRQSFGHSKVLSESEVSEIIEVLLSCVRSISKTPCFVYALRHWVSHYEGATLGSVLDGELLAFLPTLLAYYCHLLWMKITRMETQTHLATFRNTHTIPRATREDSLFRALARMDCDRIVKILLAQGIDVNYIPGASEYPEQGLTLLSWAIACQRRESFKALLRNEDVRVNYSLPHAMKPLHHAVRCKDRFYTAKLAAHPDININIRYQVGTALHTAITAQNVSAVDILLDHPDIDVWAPDQNGQTAYSQFFRWNVWGPILGKLLQLTSKDALRVGVSHTSQLFLAGIHEWDEYEQEILRQDPLQVLVVDPSTGLDALTFYAYFGRREKLLWILDRLPHKGFPIRATSSRYDLLHLCANQGWEDVVLVLQRRYKLKSLDSDHYGRTLLHWALEHCWDIDRIDWTDYNVARLDVQDRDGLTALHIAVMNRNMDAVELLVSSGANCFLKDKKGMSPAHLAAELGFRKALDYFIQMPQREFGRTRDGASLLHLLAIWLDGPIVRNFVLSKKALVNVVDKQRRTPLHYASMSDNAATAEQLLKLGALVDLRDDNGRTALHEALRGRAITTARLLLRHGANAKATDAFRQNCLHMSLRYGSRELITYFIESRVDINAIDNFGMQPIHRACGAGLVQDIAQLIRAGVNWGTACTATRYSPLDAAVEARDAEAVSFIVSSIEDSPLMYRTKKDVFNRALKIASEYEFTTIEQILLRAGAYVDKTAIKARRWYMPGAVPEHHRLPLTLYLRKSRTEGKKKNKKEIKREQN